jgi:hypothetical protein
LQSFAKDWRFSETASRWEGRATLLKKGTSQSIYLGAHASNNNNINNKQSSLKLPPIGSTSTSHQTIVHSYYQ